MKDDNLSNAHLRRIICLTEEKIFKSSKRLRDLIFNDDSMVSLFNEVYDIVYESKLDLDILLKTTEELQKRLNDK
jgi:hypothetical protein